MDFKDRDERPADPRWARTGEDFHNPNAKGIRAWRNEPYLMSRGPVTASIFSTTCWARWLWQRYALCWRHRQGRTGEQGWMMKYQTADGISCCHETDTVAIPNEDAASAKIGSQILAQFPTGPMIVTVNAIHATEDKKGRAMVSKFGCLFKAFGG